MPIQSDYKWVKIKPNQAILAILPRSSGPSVADPESKRTAASDPHPPLHQKPYPQRTTVVIVILIVIVISVAFCPPSSFPPPSLQCIHFYAIIRP
jgi:hypothetical protein